jgi:hypothetical protein
MTPGDLVATPSVDAHLSGMCTAVMAAAAVIAASMMAAAGVVVSAAVMTTAVVAATVSSLGLGHGRWQGQGRQHQTCRPNRPQQWHFHGSHDVLLGKQFI